MSIYTIYKITNTLNGKSYIGYTSRKLGERWSEHVQGAKSYTSSYRLWADIRDFGSEAFERKILRIVQTEDKAKELEAYYIKKYDTYENGYNQNLGGAGFKVFPDEIKRKISEAQKGKYIPPETRAKMSAAKKGKTELAEHFGKFNTKGSANPKSKTYLIRFPDGTEHKITGLRAFCREHNLHGGYLREGKCEKGYLIVARFNGQSESSYTQASGNGGHPADSETQDEDMVFSSLKDGAAK